MSATESIKTNIEVTRGYKVPLIYVHLNVCGLRNVKEPFINATLITWIFNAVAENRVESEICCS